MKRRSEHVKELKEEVRGWTQEEALAKEREHSEQLFRLKFQFASGQTDTLQKIRERRKVGGKLQRPVGLVPGEEMVHGRGRGFGQ